jgi:hypothetical protein
MRGNYEFLLSKANGNWVSIIGQDDAIMPFAIHELRESLRKVPNLAVLTSRRSYAYWPDTNGEFGRFQFIYPLTKNKVEAKSSKKFLTKCLKGFAEYSQGPQLYTGSFVSRPVLERILISQGGELFPYPIPDVSSSASILLFVDVYHYSNLPLFLVGTSGGSTGILLERTLINHKSASKIGTAYQEAFNGQSEKTFDYTSNEIGNTVRWDMTKSLLGLKWTAGVNIQNVGYDNSTNQLLFSIFKLSKWCSFIHQHCFNNYLQWLYLHNQFKY